MGIPVSSSQGTLYRGVKLGKPVVVKIMQKKPGMDRSEQEAKFQQEATVYEMMQPLLERDPDKADLFAQYGGMGRMRNTGEMCIVIEYINGGDLHNFLAEIMRLDGRHELKVP